MTELKVVKKLKPDGRSFNYDVETPDKIATNLTFGEVLSLVIVLLDPDIAFCKGWLTTKSVELSDIALELAKLSQKVQLLESQIGTDEEA